MAENTKLGMVCLTVAAYREVLTAYAVITNRGSGVERYGFARIEPCHKAWVRAFVYVNMCQRSLAVFSFQDDLA
jgi:hypothetical protein